MTNTNPPCYIFAGGQNRRMHGKHKAFLEFDGKRAINILICSLRKLDFDRISIVTNKKSLFDNIANDIDIIEDIVVGKGPMGALYTALMNAQTGSILCIPCDMPFINPELLIELADYTKKENSDCTVIVSSYGIEPLLALYHTRLRKVVFESIGIGKLSLTKFIRSINTIYLNLDKPNNELCNINTPEDYRRIAQKRSTANNLNIW